MSNKFSRFMKQETDWQVKAKAEAAKAARAGVVPGGPQIKVVEYKGAKDYERGLQKMLAEGWKVEDTQSRRKGMTLGTGLIGAKKGIFTITYVKEGASGEAVSEPQEASEGEE